MAERREFPKAITDIQQSLEPFIKPRQDIKAIRRVARVHLTSHLQKNEVDMLYLPLSLAGTSHGVNAIPNGLKGLPREYIRCLRVNAKARAEYGQLSRDCLIHGEQNLSQVEESRRSASDSSNTSVLAEFLVGLVNTREEHDRLSIIQDYIDNMALKPVSTAEYLDPQVVLNGLEPIPKLPQEVMDTLGVNQHQTSSRLRPLVEKLEKSVLRAKMLLKREQLLLSKVKATQKTNVGSKNRLRALGDSRNELIGWIESELMTAGDTSEEILDCSVQAEKVTGIHIDSELLSMQRQYLRYTKARQSLILSTTLRIDSPVNTHFDAIVNVAESDETDQSSAQFHVLLTYLDKAVLHSNEQKALIQQKSHLATSLAKQLKDSGQGIERLAEESHLLASHPTSGTVSKASRVQGSFGDILSSQETPNSARRVKAWDHATRSARNMTESIVSEMVGEGDTVLTDARDVLLEMHHMLGSLGESGAPPHGNSSGLSNNIWESIDGNLGAIKEDE